MSLYPLKATLDSTGFRVKKAQSEQFWKILLSTPKEDEGKRPERVRTEELARSNMQLPGGSPVHTPFTTLEKSQR